MPFKVVEVALKLGLSGFTAPLGAAASQVRGFGTDLSKAASDGSGNMEKVGKATAVAGAVMLAGFGMAAKATMGFEQELSNLQAASGATSEQMGLLRDQALEAGAATSFSASEAAQAQTELAKAGVSTADILGGALEGSLALAAAGSIDLARAAELGANAMATFGLKGSDMGRIADTLAAGANKSAADVETIGQALQQTGLVADQFGLSLEETVGVLSMFSQAGLKGSDAGTSMKTMLSRLVPQTAEAKTTMEQLGIEMFDAQGNFIGIEGAAGELKEGLSGLTQEQRAAAMQTIFGADAIRAATILYEGGAEGVDEWTQKVTDSGYAGEVAAMKLDNLAGDVEALGGSIETVLIGGGSKATGALRFLAQQATDSVNAFGSLPGPVQSAGVAIAGVGGSALVTVGALGNLAPKISDGMKALRGMGGAGNLAANGLAAVGNNAGKLIPLAAGLAVAWQIYANRQAESKARTDELTQSIKDQREGVVDATEATLGQLLAESKAAGAIDKTGESYETFNDIIRHSGDELDELYDAFSTLDPTEASEGFFTALDRAAEGGNEVAKSLQDMVDAGNLSEDELFKLVRTLDELSDEHDTATDKARRAAQAEREVGSGAEEGAAGADELTGALGENALASEEATAQLKEYGDALKAQFDPLFGMIDAMHGTRDAQLAVADAEQTLNDVMADGESTAADVAKAQNDLRDAHIAAGTAALDLQQASLTLQDAIDNQGLSADGASEMLQHWIDTAVISQEDARILAEEFGIVIGKQEEMTSTPAVAHVSSQGVPRTRAELGAVRDSAHSIPVSWTTVARTAKTNESRTALTGVRDAAFGIPASRNVNVTTSGVQYAIGQLDNLAQRINNLIRNGNVHVSVGGGGGVPLAAGGIVEFAGGGMTVQSFARGGESHIAQIARPGDFRLWAEPETGGEAYIPLANDWRRPRAVSVLEAVSRRFGLQVAPQGTGGGTTVVNHVSVPIHVSADLSAMAMARLEDAAGRAARGALASAMAGAG